MRQCTTPRHSFTVPFDTDTVEKCRITYAQCGQRILKKETEDCEIEQNKISCQLTQEQTLLFDPNNKAQIQLQVLQASGDALVSDIHTISVKDCLSGEVL